MVKKVEIIPVKLPDGSRIHVEATYMGGEEYVSFDSLPFDEVNLAIEKITNAIILPFEKIKPKKAVVEFGLEIGLESGQLTALLVKGTGTANLKITLEWES